MSKNIALLGTYYEQSHGDAILFDCVEYIYKQCCKSKNINVNFKIIDMFGKKEINYDDNNKKSILYTITNKINILKNHKIYKNLKKFYEEEFQNVDLLVIVGGGIFKYSVGANFIPIYDLITSIANEKNISVIFNAVGVEGEHNLNDKRFKKLKKIMNRNSVKMCSSRDRFEVFKKYIEKENIKCIKVADTGIWTSEALGIEKDKNSEYIGLNIIAPSRFKDYGKEILEKDLIIFWKNIINILKKRNYKFQIFTNGMIADYEFSKKVIEASELTEKNILLSIPQNEYEMVKNISKFKCVIANRLHSCIVAYSLDIPAIGLAWNDKLIYWGNEIKCSERFFDYNQFNAEKIVDEMENAIKEGYDNEYRKKYKQTVYEFIEESLKYI